MKTKFFIGKLGILALAVCLWGCSDDSVTVTGITVDRETLPMDLGDKVQVTVQPVPAGVSFDVRQVKWKSSDEMCATVTQFGIVSAVESGTATITATYNGQSIDIPVTIDDPVGDLPKRKGSWLFDDANALFKADLGNDLVPAKGGVGGAPFVAPTPDISGYSAVVGPKTYVGSVNGAIRVQKNYYLQAIHGIAPNPLKVNEYTVMWDIKYPASDSQADSFKALLQASPTNSNDADVFIVGKKMGQSHSGRSEEEDVTPDVWHRIVVSVKCGTFIRYYCDGKYLKTNSGEGIDPRGIDGESSLESTVLFLCDGDNDGITPEEAVYDCSEIAIWDVALTDAQVGKLDRRMRAGFHD
jgi:hypothetical protein